MGATSLTDLYQTFWNFAGVFPRSEDVHVLLGLSSHHFLSTFLTFSSNLISIRMIPCGRNSFYSFTPIIFKLWVLVPYSLKMCVWF